MNTNWTPVSIPDPAIVAREEKRIELERGCAPLEFTLTPQDRDVAQIARCELLALKRGQFQPGVVVTQLQPSDLTDSERAAFGMGAA